MPDETKPSATPPADPIAQLADEIRKAGGTKWQIAGVNLTTVGAVLAMGWATIGPPIRDFWTQVNVAIVAIPKMQVAADKMSLAADQMAESSKLTSEVLQELKRLNAATERGADRHASHAEAPFRNVP